MISTFTALFDSNVFYGARLRSFILHQAQTDVFRARWTEDIHREWIGHLLNNRPELDPASIAKTRAAMDRSVEDCLVTGYQGLIDGLTLPDPNDRHVLAAAITARASAIVTFNLKDFPPQVLEQFGLHACSPDNFLLDLADLSQSQFVEAAVADFQHYVKPPLDFASYTESLASAGIPETAAILNRFKVLF